MKALLICPADRTEVAVLALKRPLALAPILGRSLLDLTLADLAHAGVKELWILAADRPDEIRSAVGRGEAWGLKVEVLPETRELTPEAARAKYRPAGASGWREDPNDVVVLDHLPGRPPGSLFTSYAAWFAEVLGQLPEGARFRLGVRQISPGVFVGLRTRVAPTARLVAPCWVGENAWIAAGALVGPGGIVESGAYVDEGAEVAQSVVGPETYIGVLTELRNSVAWGRGLLNWETGSFTEVVDDILLSDLSNRKSIHAEGSWIGRVLAGLVLLLTFPILAVAWLRRPKGQPLFLRREAVRTPWEGLDGTFSRTVVYHELSGVPGLLRRWPELWKVLTGEFNWVGNRPLTAQQAARLSGEFERLWLAVPSGVVSLADVEGCPVPFGDEARAHSSFYAVHPSRHGDIRMLGRMFARAFLNVS